MPDRCREDAIKTTVLLVFTLLALPSLADADSERENAELSDERVEMEANAGDYNFTDIFNHSDRRAMNRFFEGVGDVAEFNITFVDVNNDGGGYYELQVVDGEGMHSFPLRDDWEYEGIRYDISGGEIQTVIRATRDNALHDVFDESPFVNGSRPEGQAATASVRSPTPVGTMTGTPTDATTGVPTDTAQTPAATAAQTPTAAATRTSPDTARQRATDTLTTTRSSDGFPAFLKRVVLSLLSTEALLIQGAAVLAGVIWYGWPDEKDGDNRV